MKHNLKKKDTSSSRKSKIFLTGRKRRYFDRKMLFQQIRHLICFAIELSIALRCRVKDRHKENWLQEFAHKLAEENVMDTISRDMLKYFVEKKKKKNSRDMFVTVLANVH